MQVEAQSKAKACPRVGAGGTIQVNLRVRPGISHQQPGSATLSQPRLAKLWGPKKHRIGEKAAAGPGRYLLTFINCSIALDARELERKRVLGSAGRTEGSVCWGLGPDPPHPTHPRWES